MALVSSSLSRAVSTAARLAAQGGCVRLLHAGRSCWSEPHHEVVVPLLRKGPVILTAHPEGCARAIREKIQRIKTKTAGETAELGNTLVIGSSQGYGLSAALTTAFGYNSRVVGVGFERPPADGKPGTPGWYNLVEMHNQARLEGRKVDTFLENAFLNATKETVVRDIKERFGKLDQLVYSLAAPKRLDERAGIEYRSVIKPIGKPFTGPTIAVTKQGLTMADSTIEAATEDEIAATVKVMGGEDWALWIDALGSADLLAEGFRTYAFSYLGPERSYPIYRHGTLGHAKEHLRETAAAMTTDLAAHCRGRADVVVSKALVTQASSVIPTVPLYIAVLYKVMRALGSHEDPTDQLVRLYQQHMAPDRTPVVDDMGLVRIDDWELSPEVQSEVDRIMARLTAANVADLADLAGYDVAQQQVYGFAVPGVDYKRATDVDLDLGRYKHTP